MLRLKQKQRVSMLKIVCVVDKENTALDRLAKGVTPYHGNLDYTVVAVHPKRPDPEQLQAFEQAAMDADIIDFQYFRTAVMLRELYPWLKNIKSILTHNNPYSYKEDKWEWADINVGNNESITEGLKEQGSPNVKHIPITTDPLFWTYKRAWEPNKNVIMVANRIESKKGILPVAIACADAGLKFILVGAVSDKNYYYDIMQTGNVEFHEQITDEELRDLYHKSTIHVCNSIDNFESGTMPILEAMQCGVPVLTRRVGHVPDLFNGDNLTIYKGDPEDVQAITVELELMMQRATPEKNSAGKDNAVVSLETQRASAWNTAKNFNFERRAYEYQKLYRELQSTATPVSVVVPIYDRPEIIRANLNAVAAQDYPNIELIVVDDNPEFNDSQKQNYMSQTLVAEFARTVSFPVRYINSGEYGSYGLARARNLGIIEATGEIIIFCDQRQIMEPNAVSELVKNLVPRVWVFGDRGNNKDIFIENFGAIYVALGS